MVLVDMVAQFNEVDELLVALLALPHHLDAVEELVEVESLRVVVGLFRMEVAQEVDLTLCQLVHAAAGKLADLRVEVVL